MSRHQKRLQKLIGSNAPARIGSASSNRQEHKINHQLDEHVATFWFYSNTKVDQNSKHYFNFPQHERQQHDNTRSISPETTEPGQNDNDRDSKTRIRQDNNRETNKTLENGQKE